MTPPLDPMPVGGRRPRASRHTFLETTFIPPPPPPPIIPVLAPAPIVIGGPPDADFGEDFSHLSMLDPNLSLLGGIANLGQAIAHRLQTPQGTLFYDKNYGKDLRAYMNEALSPAKLAQLKTDVESQALEDERVLSATSSVVFNQGTSSLNVSLSIMTAAGPFLLVLDVTKVTVTLLNASRIQG